MLGEGGAPGVPALVRALGSDRIPVVLTATTALARIGPPARAEGLPALERLAASASGVVAGHAERAVRVLRLALPRVDDAWDWRRPFDHEGDLLLRVDHRGRMWVDAGPVTLEGLGAEILRARTVAARIPDLGDESPPAEAPAPFEGRLVVALDRDLPWIVARAILAVCARDGIRQHEIEFAVYGTGNHGEPVGRLVVKQPWEELTLDETGTRYRSENWAVRVEVDGEGGSFGADELRRALRDGWREGVPRRLVIGAAGDVRVEDVLRVVAAGRDADYREISFLDAGPADLLEMEPEERVRRTRVRPAAQRIFVRVPEAPR
jgi:hypothetical protein